MLQSMPEEQREMIEGYVAGYNQYLASQLERRGRLVSRQGMGLTRNG